MIRERVGRLEGVRTSVGRIPSTGSNIWERVPGIVSWIVVLSPIWLTLIMPSLGLATVVVVTIYFAIRASIYGPRALINRKRVLTATSQDWLARLNTLDRSGGALDWRQTRVTLMVRAYRERNEEMLRAGLESVYASNWTKVDGKMVNVEVLFATEEDDPYTPALVDSLAQEFAGRLDVRQIRHPEESDALPGPSTAMNYAGRMLYREALRKGITASNWIVADFDADTLFHPEYVPCLVYSYVTDPDREKKAFQPVVLFTIDYWKAPLHSRLSALGTSVLTLGWNRRPEIAFTGAAAGLSALHTLGFWPRNSHSQDSGIQLRFQMRYGSTFRVVGLPIPLWVYPVMMTGEQSTLQDKIESYWRSVRTLFRQSARWREGPLDEFAEASVLGQWRWTLHRLWTGIERDTLTLLPGYGLVVATSLIDPAQLPAATGMLRSVAGGTLTLVSLLGLVVFWQMLRTKGLVPSCRSQRRTILELILFWVVFSVYLPLFTAVAGLKTSTEYLLGGRPRGHFMPTPK